MSELTNGERAAGFRTAAERMQSDRAARAQLAQRIIPFGVGFLDRATRGIWPYDVVLVGARSGIGKTELAAICATHNAALGRRVHYFALEGEPNEIERRARFKRLVRLAGEEGSGMRYVDWLAGDYGALEEQHEAALLMQERESTLRTFYRDRDFTADTLESKLLAIQSDTDLVVVDHLHYIDSDGEQNENKAGQRLIKTIRDVGLSIGKPLIIVAHVKKSSRRERALVPELEDFRGTSDIGNVCTKAIMIGRAPNEYAEPNDQPWEWQTLMQAAKCRPDGTLPGYVAKVVYNARQGLYANDFILGTLTDFGQKWERLSIADRRFPRWAREYV